MEEIKFIWFLPFIILLVVVFLLRLKRESKARKLIKASPNNVKLYLAGSKKIISDVIKVYTINSQNPFLGRDRHGNYVVLQSGENHLTLGFMALKDFAPAAAVPVAAPAIIEAKEKHGEITCNLNSGMDYILSYHKDSKTFIVTPWQA